MRVGGKHWGQVRAVKFYSLFVAFAIPLVANLSVASGLSRLVRRGAMALREGRWCTSCLLLVRSDGWDQHVVGHRHRLATGATPPATAWDHTFVENLAVYRAQHDNCRSFALLQLVCKRSPAVEVVRAFLVDHAMPHVRASMRLHVVGRLSGR